MNGFAVGLFVGMGIGLLAWPLLSAWLWRRERARVSREAELLRRNSAGRRVVLPGTEELLGVDRASAPGPSGAPPQAE